MAKQKKEVFDRYPIIQHYTSFEACINILKECKLRAFHYKSMNDISEFNHTFDILCDRLSKSISADQLSNERYPFTNMFRPLGERRYVACFEKSTNKSIGEENGRLSMWRSYAEGGVALRIDTKLFWEEIKDYDVSDSSAISILDEVNYDYNSNSFKKSFFDFQKHRTEIIEHHNSGTLHKLDFEPILKIMLKLVFCYKNPYFKEENELRIGIVNQAPKLSDSDIEEYATKPKFPVGWANKAYMGSCEFIELPLPLKCIKEIVVGPGIYQKTCEYQLNNENFGIPISSSDIPHR